MRSLFCSFFGVVKSKDGGGGLGASRSVVTRLYTAVFFTWVYEYADTTTCRGAGGGVRLRMKRWRPLVGVYCSRAWFCCVPPKWSNPLLSFAGAGEVSQTVDMIRFIGY